MSELGLLVSIFASSSAGCLVGFITGLVPSLHINNIAAAVVASSGAALASFAYLAELCGQGDAGLLISCFLVSALVSHSFSEAVPNTYVGIPAGDAVTVLPAHRLAKAGLGWTAVRASMDGSLAGVLLGCLSLVPVSVLLGPSAGVYELLKSVMGPFIVLLSAALVLSDGLVVPASRHRAVSRAVRTSKVAAVFVASGILGLAVLDTNYFACAFPGSHSPFVAKSSLLLPLFAGLFGLPTLMLSLGLKQARDTGLPLACKVSRGSDSRSSLLSLTGAVLVGWIPGLTSGSSATLCSSLMRRPVEDARDVAGSVRFIWLYSSISTAGAVLSVGALFTILRSRSGVMEAVSRFISPEPVLGSLPDLLAPSALLLSMVLSGLLSYAAMASMRDRLRRVGRALCSRRLSVAAMVFVCGLVTALTGLRGLYLLSTACALGLVPPVVGVRRIHLMGCLLVPVALMFLT